MVYDQTIQKTKTGFEEAITYFKDELSKIRTSRADTSLIENISFESYGTKITIRDSGTISVIPPDQIVITPWDKNILEVLAGAISKSSLGLNPIVDGEKIRISIPPLTEEKRKEFTKLVHSKAEEVRISIRQRREDAWNEIQKSESENEKFRGKEELQKLVDEYNKKIKELEERKEKELMTI